MGTSAASPGPFAQEPEHAPEVFAEFLVDEPDAFGALKLIGRHPETDEHADQQDSVPDLQPPAKGFEDHGGSAFDGVAVAPAGRDEIRAELFAKHVNVAVERTVSNAGERVFDRVEEFLA